jgi:hypothetical protein
LDVLAAYAVAAARCMSPAPAGVIGRPPSAYSFSLLRSVRIERVLQGFNHF